MCIHLTCHPSMQYHDVSAKSNYNFVMPFLWLAQKLTGDAQLHLVEMPALHPPEVYMDPEDIQKYEQELQESAAVMTLPAGDDDNDDI